MYYKAMEDTAQSIADALIADADAGKMLLSRGLYVKKKFIRFGLAMLWSSHCFAAAIAKDANVAVMDFGTRPGATTSEISINNAEYTSTSI